MDNTIIQQGRFTSAGSAVTIELRSGVDWMRVYNTTVAAGAQTTAVGVEYYWQAGFSQDAAWEYKKAGAGVAGANLSTYNTTGGFTLVDSSANPNGNVQATITGINTDPTPIVSTSGANGLIPGQIVRLSNVATGNQLGGMDFTVGSSTNGISQFSLAYMPAIAAATTGSWRLIKYDPIFYPRRRYITKITQAAQAVVSMSVTHGYKVGQLVRMVVPAVFGMTEMDGLKATIVAINTATTEATGNTITLNVDSSAFTAFAFPVSAVSPFTFAQVVPMGEDTPYALSQGVDILSGATVNTAYIGMQLAAGANSPAGVTSDVIYWVAGKSFSIDNN